MSRCFALCLLCLLFVCRVSAALEPPKLSDPIDFHWMPEQASILYSLEQYEGDYEIQLIRPAKSLGAMKIRFLKNGKERLAFAGHSKTVFVVEGDVVYYADYNYSAYGCVVKAYDLDKRKQLWSSILKGIPMPDNSVGHSGYANAVTLGFVTLPPKALIVYGKESFGDYSEVLDRKTGKTSDHKLFRHEYLDNFPRDTP